MKDILIVLGNISFEGDKGTKATVHEIHGLIFIRSDYATEVAEYLCNLTGAYVIPDIWTGKIVYECDPNTVTRQYMD